MIDKESGNETVEEAATPAATIDPAELNEDQCLGLTLVQEICAASGLQAQAVARAVNSPYLSIEILGEDVRSTWGRMGQALDALQLLANMILSHRTRSDVRLMLDAEGYRGRRAETLQRKAHELADEVKARNEEAEFEPMPPHERRIIHTALQDDPDIMTYSEGDEPNRRIVLAPRVK